MIDPIAIRRNGYALAELESTLGCFFAGLAYLSIVPDYEDRTRAARGLDMLVAAIDWQPSMALICERPSEAA